MKLKNDKTNPFSLCVALAETNRPASPILSFAVNTQQKIHKSTTDLQKLGTPKNEQTNPTKTSFSGPDFLMVQHVICECGELLTLAFSGVFRALFAIMKRPALCAADVSSARAFAEGWSRPARRSGWRPHNNDTNVTD